MGASGAAGGVGGSPGVLWVPGGEAGKQLCPGTRCAEQCWCLLAAGMLNCLFPGLGHAVRSCFSGCWPARPPSRSFLCAALEFVFKKAQTKPPLFCPGSAADGWRGCAWSSLLVFGASYMQGGCNCSQSSPGCHQLWGWRLQLAGLLWSSPSSGCSCTHAALCISEPSNYIWSNSCDFADARNVSLQTTPRR